MRDWPCSIRRRRTSPLPPHYAQAHPAPRCEESSPIQSRIESYPHKAQSPWHPRVRRLAGCPPRHSGSAHRPLFKKSRIRAEPSTWLEFAVFAESEQGKNQTFRSGSGFTRAEGGPLPATMSARLRPVSIPIAFVRPDRRRSPSTSSVGEPMAPSNIARFADIVDFPSPATAETTRQRANVRNSD